MSDDDNRNQNHIPGFPGDGGPDIVLHHDLPSAWTKKTTIWSVSMIAIATIIAIAAIVLTAGKA